MNDYTQDAAFMKASPEEKHAFLMDNDPAYAKASKADQEAFIASFQPQAKQLDLGKAEGIRAEKLGETIARKVKQAVPALELIGKTLETPAGLGAATVLGGGPAAARDLASLALKKSPALGWIASSIPPVAKAVGRHLGRHVLPYAGAASLYEAARSLTGKK